MSLSRQISSPQAVLLGLALIAGAVLAVGFSTGSEAAGNGPWQIAAGGNQTAWRVNTTTGATWFCSILAAPAKPACQPVSDVANQN